jgi:type I restriction enzyme S subunit
MSYNRLHAGQLVYSKLFGWEGAIAVVPDEFDGFYVSSEFPTFEIRRDRASSGYFQHLARWPGLHAGMASCTSGLGQRRQRVQVDKFLSLTVPIPPDHEQAKIVAKLDFVQEHRRRCAEKHKHARNVILAFHNCLCRVKGRSVRVGDHLALIRRAVNLDGLKTYRPIGLRSFGRGFIHYEPVPGERLSKLRYFEVPNDALVLSNIKAWEGAIAVSSKEVGCIASNRFLSYVPLSDAVNVNYLRYFFLSEYGLPLIQAASPGMADRNRTLGIAAFEKLCIPLPDQGEQHRIASRLDRVYEAFRRMEDRERQFDALITSTLNEAFAVS